MSVRLEQLLADLGDSPHRIGGIPPGIISGDDFDVTDAAFATLALAPDMARLLIDIGAALEYYVNVYYRHDDKLIERYNALLARLDALGKDTA